MTKKKDGTHIQGFPSAPVEAATIEMAFYIKGYYMKLWQPLPMEETEVIPKDMD